MNMQSLSQKMDNYLVLAKTIMAKSAVDSLKKKINHFTEFSINDRDGSNLVPVSAVCSEYGTLYMFTKSSSKNSQLVLCDNRINSGDPIYLDICGNEPLSLFGGNTYVAAISSEGEVILINSDSIKNYLNSRIPSFSLPDGEKATSVSFYDKLLIALVLVAESFHLLYKVKAVSSTFHQLMNSQIMKLSACQAQMISVNSVLEKKREIFQRLQKFHLFQGI